MTALSDVKLLKSLRANLLFFLPLATGLYRLIEHHWPSEGWYLGWFLGWLIWNAFRVVVELLERQAVGLERQAVLLERIAAALTDERRERKDPAGRR